MKPKAKTILERHGFKDDDLVVCPDDEYRDIIESQGYGFIKYEKEY